MSGLLRNIGLLMAVVLVASMARAEGVGPARPDASNDRRLYGVVGLAPINGGHLAVGGPSLRRLAAGSRRWETLHTIPKDNLYRVAGDDAGRILAAWEKDPSIHFFSPGQPRVALPKPEMPPGLSSYYQVMDLEFMPNGRDALVFMTGELKVSGKGFSGPSRSTAAYRIALDGKSEAELLFRVDHGYRLHTSVRGAVFAMNKHPGRQCDHGGCIISAIVAYELTESGVRQKVLADNSQFDLERAELLRGSDNERVGLLVELWKIHEPKRVGLMRWRYGDERAEFHSVLRPEREGPRSFLTFLLTTAGEFIELRGQDTHLEVWRRVPEGDARLASLQALQKIDTQLHGVGERSDGSLWLQWGDHLGLLAPGKPPRSYSLQQMLPRRSEWAAAHRYVKAPEHLWVGIDGPGRHYERVDFSEMEKRAKPWPSGGSATGTVVTNTPKDLRSNGTRVYNVTTMRPVVGSIVTIGGSALRRLPKGATRWETLHAVPGDSLYRVGADDSGRLLAAWEEDPSIHFFSADGKQHLTFPKPAPLPGIIRGNQVTALEFSPDGRDAVVFMTGDLDMGTRDSTAVYRIALDGQSPPRLIFRVDDAVRLHTSRAGAVFMLPQKPGGQECSHRTCWPMSAIVAYEFAGDGFRQRTLLRGTDAHVSSASLVRGSDDERVALVLSLTMQRGTQWLNGGRAVLRWRWGQDAVDYHPVPGNSSLMSEFLLTTSNDFIETTVRGENGTEYLDIHRYRPGGAVETSSLKAMQKLPSLKGLGERSDGGLWLHWGDRLVLLPPGKPPRAFDIDPLFERGFEWAGAHVYVKAPEALWIGLDGRGRDFVRVDMTEAERRAITLR